HTRALPSFPTRRSSDLASRHPNGVQRIERVYIAVKDVAAAAAHYARVLGVPAPKMERGTVIHADMAIFQLGATALGLAQPAARGDRKSTRLNSSHVAIS